MNMFETLMAQELAVMEARALQEERLLFSAASGGPFWGVGKMPAQPGQIRGLAEYLPSPRRPR